MLPTDLKNKRILLSPLDWGFGHTTRCVSLIRQFLEQGNEVVFAGNSEQKSFIGQEFEGIELVHVEGYNIAFDDQKKPYTQLFRQRKKLTNGIKNEKAWLYANFEKIKPDVIISDNRYGFCHPDATNIFITHQLNLQVPFLRSTANNWIKKRIEQFDACWIPDDQYRTLSGNLSRGKISIEKHFIGVLSRFKKLNLPCVRDYLVVLTGPEPQRSNFAELIIKKLMDADKTYMIVGDHTAAMLTNPSSSELNELICESNTVIARAGYTSIMELASLKQDAILVPTPGQFEQEYLANHICLENFTFCSQDELTIA